MYVHVMAAPDLSTPFACLLFLVLVSAGYPSPADDYLDGSMDLNQHLVKHPTATFFVRVAGESMREAGIHSDDVLMEVIILKLLAHPMLHTSKIFRSNCFLLAST